MGRKSAHNLPPGIQLDQHGQFWATLEGDEARLWRKRYPGRSLPRRKATSLKDALKLQRQLIDDLKAARDPNAENPKVVDWVQTCIDRKRDLAVSTIRRYRQSLTWQIAPHRIGRMRLLQVMRQHVEEWIDSLITQTRQGDDEALDAYSIRNAFALLRLAFNMAVADGLLVKNPCTGVKLPRPDDEEIHPLTPEQVDTFLGLIDTLDRDSPHRNAALYHVAIRCGPRQGELLGLRWKDVDLQRRELRIASQIQKGKRSRTKTPQSRRTLPLTADLVRVLTWHKQNQAEERNVSADGWNAAGLVFCSERGTPISPRNLDRQYKALLKRAELPIIRFHDLRHAYAALSIAAGVDLYTLSRRMGHSSITVTADRYGHLYQGNNQDVDSLDRLLKRAK
jgi:integrase